MVRKAFAVAGLLILISVVPGCGPRDRPGLLSRFRARSAMPDCPAYGNGNEAMVMDPGMYGQPVGMPCCAPGHGGMPFTAVPGSIIQGTPEMMPMPIPGNAIPPLNPTPGITPPGSATPRPADPSADPTGFRKGTAVPASKTGLTP
jgi:hypothetical protein